ncbi:hypothetical protein [Burkholderia plantarii]|uniref:hypothetical protein n=1 Tax=Burkholderia plantarii TaxID=41899 RepID=UPI001F5B3275|nr:hypothetical protein [Burkholderia plantarii]
MEALQVARLAGEMSAMISAIDCSGCPACMNDAISGRSARPASSNSRCRVCATRPVLGESMVSSTPENAARGNLLAAVPAWQGFAAPARLAAMPAMTAAGRRRAGNFSHAWL